MWYNHVSATHRRLKKRAKLSSDYPANLVTHYVTYKFDWFWIFAESESLSRESDTRVDHKPEYSLLKISVTVGYHLYDPKKDRENVYLQITSI